MRTGSLRWWFEDRTTGRLTVAQFPNWQLWAALASSIVARLLSGAGTVGSIAEWASHGLWILWAGFEVVSGVNPWRRLLGLAVIAWRVSLMVS